MWKSKGTRIAKTILKKEQSWKICTIRSQETYGGTKAIWYWKSVDTNINSTEESPETAKPIWSMIFKMHTKIIQ